MSTCLSSAQIMSDLTKKLKKANIEIAVTESLSPDPCINLRKLKVSHILLSNRKNRRNCQLHSSSPSLAIYSVNTFSFRPGVSRCYSRLTEMHCAQLPGDKVIMATYMYIGFKGVVHSNYILTWPNIWGTVDAMCLKNACLTLTSLLWHARWKEIPN